MATVTTVASLFGGFAVDRAVFRRYLPDDRWFVYAAGLVNPGDANSLTVSLVYQKDDMSLVTLGSKSYSGAGEVKAELGPFDVYATPGVSKSEAIAVIRLRAIKNAGVNGTLSTWTIWPRLTALPVL